MKTKKETNRINLIVSGGDFGEKREYISVTKEMQLDISRRTYEAGITLERVFYTPRSKRIFAEFYSCWQRSDNSGRCVGSYVKEKSGDLGFCQRIGIDPSSVGIEPEVVE